MTLLIMLALSISLMACSSKKEIVKEVPSYTKTLALRDFNAISCSGAANVHFTHSTAWRGERSSEAAGSAAVLRQIIPSRI